MSEKLSYLTTAGRNTGKTTALCEAAKKIGATVLCHSSAEARRLSEHFQVETATLETVSLMGSPFFVDTYAVGMYAHRMEKTVAGLEYDLNKIRQELEETKTEYAVLKEQVKEKAKSDERK